MTKFVLAYRGGGEMESEPEAMEAVMEQWGAWFASLGDAVVDGGNPFAGHHFIAADGSVTPGGSADALSGYSIIQADDLDRAVALAKGCPVLAAGGTIEVAEAIDM